MFQTSRQTGQWGKPQALPDVKGVTRPYDVYDMATDSAGHVHMVMIGYANGSDAMSVLHLEWNGARWLAPRVVASSPPYPEFPHIVIANGNHLHVSWFGGDKPTTDRTPIGIWYSSTFATAPTQSSGMAIPTPAPRLPADTLPVPRAPVRVSAPEVALPDFTGSTPTTTSEVALPLSVAIGSTILLIAAAILLRGRLLRR
jgi:hypothetical protein